MSVFTEGQIGSKVRVPFSHLANNGDVSMDDIEQASGDPDGAVVVDVQGGGDGGDESIMMAEQAGPRETTDVMEVTDQPAYGAPGGAPPAPGVPSGVATPGAEPAPAPAVPGQPTPAPARARRNIQLESRFNPNVRYTNEDFYGPRGPDIYSDNAVGGKLYIPRAGELPMGLFASFMQESQKRKAKVEGAIADLMKSSQVKPTADPYQPAFAKLVKDWQNNYVAGLAEQYGGNSQLAWGEIAKEGSEANKAWQDGHAALEALGQFVKFQWADADKYITEVRDGKLRTTPEQKKRAEDVFYGIGNLKGNMAGGDFVKLAQQTEALKRDMNELKWFNEFVLPMAPEAYKKASSEPVVDTVGGKRILRQRTKEETDKEFHRIIAQAGRDMIGADPNELQKKVEAWFPRVKSETETVKFFPEGKGKKGGGGGADTAAAVQTSVVSGPTGAVERTIIFPTQVTGGKTHKVAKGNFNTVRSGGVDLYAPGLTWNDQGHFFIEGTKLGADDITRVKQNVEGWTGSGDDDGESNEQVIDYITTNKIGKTDRVAANNQGGEMEVLFGNRDPFAVIASQLQQRGWDVDAARVQKEWSKKQSRDKITQALK